MNDSRIKMLEQSATNAAIAWAKSGNGYENMKRAVNDYIKATGANNTIGNDAEAILHGRRAAAHTDKRLCHPCSDKARGTAPS